MTCPALLRRTPAPAQADVAGPGRGAARLADRLRADDAAAQFCRFVLVGGISSLLYGLVFVLVVGLGLAGDQRANLLGAVASSVLANELHRRLTFHAGERVSWFTAQWEGGAVAVAGLLGTGLALGWLDEEAGEVGVPTRLAVVAAVTAAIGLARFAALRWVWTPREQEA